MSSDSGKDAAADLFVRFREKQEQDLGQFLGDELVIFDRDCQLVFS